MGYKVQVGLSNKHLHLKEEDIEILFGKGHKLTPTFKWCRDLGEGWYLPAINEVLRIGHLYNNGRIKFDRKAREQFNNRLKEHGGVKMDRLMYYFSSTEGDDAWTAMTTHMGIEPPFVEQTSKNISFLVRAMHKF